MQNQESALFRSEKLSIFLSSSSMTYFTFSDGNMSHFSHFQNTRVGFLKLSNMARQNYQNEYPNVTPKLFFST